MRTIAIFAAALAATCACGAVAVWADGGKSLMYVNNKGRIAKVDVATKAVSIEEDRYQGLPWAGEVAITPDGASLSATLMSKEAVDPDLAIDLDKLEIVLVPNKPILHHHVTVRFPNRQWGVVSIFPCSQLEYAAGGQLLYVDQGELVPGLASLYRACSRSELLPETPLRRRVAIHEPTSITMPTELVPPHQPTAEDDTLYPLLTASDQLALAPDGGSVLLSGVRLTGVRANDLGAGRGIWRCDLKTHALQPIWLGDTVKVKDGKSPGRRVLALAQHPTTGVVYCSDGTTIYTIDADGKRTPGKTRFTANPVAADELRVSTMRPYWMAWSPDGKRLALAVGTCLTVLDEDLTHPATLVEDIGPLAQEIQG